MMSDTIKRTRAKTILDKIEDALIDRLDNVLPKWVDIEPWPEDPNSFDFANRKGIVLVHYSGSRFVEPEGQSTNQKRGMSWALILKTRSFRGENGAYAVLEDIRQALQGQSFEGAGPVHIVRDDLVREDQGVWQWNVVIVLPVQAVAKRQNPRQATRLLQPLTQSPDGTSR